MIERNKNKLNQSNDNKVTSATDISYAELKSKSLNILKKGQLDESIAVDNISIPKNDNFQNIKQARDIKTTSTADYFKVNFVPVEGTRSGYFLASTKRGHSIEAVLEDDANYINPILKYKSVGDLRTIIVPVGEIGDRAFFKATDLTTGAVVTADAVTKSLAGGIFSWLKRLFF